MIGDRSHDIIAARANGAAHAAGCTHTFAHPGAVTVAALRDLE
jgi:phosphoglycolate phosphatase-like HAD superfamily hydrolase